MSGGKNAARVPHFSGFSLGTPRSRFWLSYELAESQKVMDETCYRVVFYLTYRLLLKTKGGRNQLVNIRQIRLHLFATFDKPFGYFSAR